MVGRVRSIAVVRQFPIALLMMNKQRTIEGRWMIHAEEGDGVFGVLSFEPQGGLTLSVKLPRSRTDELFLKAAANRRRVPRVIKGTDATGNPPMVDDTGYGLLHGSRSSCNSQP